MGQQAALYFDPTNNHLVTGTKTDNGYQLKKEKQEPSVEYESILLKLVGKCLTDNKVIVIDSSKSGVGRDNRNIYQPILKPIFEDFNVTHEYIMTESFDTISSIGALLTAGDYTVILISGDTSVNEFINSLTSGKDHRGDITIFNIPFGTGNSLALSLDLLDEFTAIRQLLLQPQVHPLNLYDIILPNETWLLQQDKRIKLLPHTMKFLIVFSWGFHASLVADSDTPEYRKYGIDRFKMAAMENLKSLQQYEGQTSISPLSNNGNQNGISREFNGPFAYWLVTPSKKFEPTFDILPNGNLFDDNIYFISFDTDVASLSYIMDIMTQVYNKGQHINNPAVTYEKIPPNHSISLTFKDLPMGSRRFCMDGSIVLLPQTGSITIKAAGNTVGNWKLFVLN